MDLFSLEAPSRRRRNGFGSLFGDELLRDEPVRQEEVTPEERESVIRELGRLTGGTVARLGSALSAPDDYFRGAVLGRTGERVDGRELLRSLGLASREDNWGNFIAGLGADVLTSPSTYLLGPAASITKAGGAAKKLGLLDTARTVATKKALSSGLADDALPLVARRTKAALEKTGRNLSTLDPSVVGRPLYGTRTARRNTTLGDLIDFADNRDAAEKAARDLLGNQYDALRGETLSKSFGIGAPFGDPWVVGDFLGKGFGDRYADALDTIGQAVRWSYPGRVAAAGFDVRVDGAINPEQQITNIANFGKRQAGGGRHLAAHTYHLSKLRSAHPEVFSEEGNRVLGRYLEDAYVDATQKAADDAYIAARPELKEYADWAAGNFQQYLEEAKKLGLSAAEMRDEYGIRYLPRRADPALEMASRKNRKLADSLSVFTGDMLRRTDAMQVPGGRNTIMDLSQDPYIAGTERLATNDTAAAVHILKKLQPMVQAGQPDVTLEQAEKIARVLHELPAEAVKKAPLFGQHPVEMVESYMKARGEALGTAPVLYDSLATFTKKGEYRDIPGGRHISVEEALSRMGLRSYDEDLATSMGAKTQMRERLAQLNGVEPDDIRLSEFSIPEQHVEMLLKARDAFTVDEVSGEFLNALDHVTQAWKGAILTWPSRAVRDLYSGVAQNWLAGANDAGAVLAAKALITQGPESAAFRSYLADIPRYAGDDGLPQFYADLAATRLYQGPSSLELGGSTFGNRALQNLPGAEPVTVGSILGELTPQSGRSWSQFGQDFGTWRSQLRPLADTKNPVLRAGEKMNSLTDGINRISGYLALLRKGYDPQAAASAIKAVQVDYSALTTFERSFLRRIFPWYSYNSRIFREVLRQLAERPGGRYGQMLRTIERAQSEADEEGYITSDLRQQIAIPLPAEWGGQPGPGTQRYLADFDVPGLGQIAGFATPGTWSGSVRETSQNVAMQAHPFLRTLAELASGQDFFTNRPLGESTSTLDALGRKITGNPLFDVPAPIEKVVESMPFVGRPLYLARALTDDRGGQSLASRGGKALFNATTGLKLKDKSAADIAADQVREAERAIDPFTNEIQQIYIPESRLPSVPDWAVQQLRVSRALKRELQAAREALKDKGKKKKPKRQAYYLDPVSLFD